MIPGRISNDKRNELYEEVWKTPVRQLAKAEGVSDVALRKRLAKFDIPLPPRGYWAKSEENRQKIVPPLLPDITRLTSNYVFGYSICRIDADSLSDDQLKNDGPFLFITEESVQRVQQFCESRNSSHESKNSAKKKKRSTKSIDISIGTRSGANRWFPLMFRNAPKGVS